MTPPRNCAPDTIIIAGSDQPAIAKCPGFQVPLSFCINHVLNQDYLIMPKWSVYIAAIWLLVSAGVCGAAGPPESNLPERRSQRILYLNSYNNGYAWSDNILEGIRSVLPVESQSLNFQMEYLDAKRYENEQMQTILFNYFSAKFARDKFDLIITSDNNALDFALRYRTQLFAGAPIVFCGINNYHPSIIEGQRAITGIAETVAFKENMRIIRRLHPQARKMIIIGSNSVTSRAIIKEIRQTIEQEKIDFSFTFKTGFKPQLLKTGTPDYLAGLSRDTVLYIVPGGSEAGNGNLYSIQEIAAMICRATELPVYSSWEFLMGTGIVGGKLASGLEQGKAAARLALRILDGEDPDKIAVKTAEGHAYIFDHNVLKRLGVDISLLPQGSRIINKPYNFYRLNRQIFWLIISGLFILAFMVVLLGISMAQKKRANQAMEKSKMQLQLVLDNIPHLVFWQDTQLNLVDVNLSFLKFFRIKDKADIINQDISSVPDLAYTAEESRQLGREVLETAAPFHARLLKIQRSDKEQVWLEINKVPLLDKKNRVAGVLSTAEDITKKINLEKQLAQAQKMEALGILSGGIAHDFNNILTSIINSTELAMDDVPDNSLTRQDLERVLSAGKRGAELVKQILTFSRPGHARFKTLDLARVVRDAMALVETSLPGNIEVVKNFAPGKFICRGDAIQIHQVVMNLCTNAYQALGGKSGRIEVKMDERILIEPDPGGDAPFNLPPGHYVELTVSDNGPGIDPEILDKVFDPFFSTKGKNIGTGLGLSMVHGIVQGHNGAISLTSKAYDLTRFTVLFPRTVQVEDEEQPAETNVCLGQGTILFVEDDPEQRQSVPRIIEKLGYLVTAADSAAQALALIRQEPSGFDLVITDYDMPKVSGLELARQLARIMPDLPVIMVSGRNVEFSRLESANIKAFIVKPYDRGILSQGISEVLCSPTRSH
ncbi:ATP-binding protein [uncultured Desulfobacter sp.]|uniref:hybrid sensor histidine kinase/response regulator n=1 Tax=uncultured Desulfobacter sp. TaxID=240139 RepID=UPI002AAB547E|nr:ATP-binding protein [uncultured Desulfobacter sp.]